MSSKKHTDLERAKSNASSTGKRLMGSSLKALSGVEYNERVLLLSHCLRPSGSCPGKFSKRTLECPEECDAECVIRRLKAEAVRRNYKGVCIAAGGKMALNFVRESRPKGIVAVACNKELEEGIKGVEEAMKDGEERPVIVAIPLLVDGCVDTEVDEEKALEAICCYTPCEMGQMSEGDHL